MTWASVREPRELSERPPGPLVHLSLVVIDPSTLVSSPFDLPLPALRGPMQPDAPSGGVRSYSNAVHNGRRVNTASRVRSTRSALYVTTHGL